MYSVVPVCLCGCCRGGVCLFAGDTFVNRGDVERLMSLFVCLFVADNIRCLLLLLVVVVVVVVIVSVEVVVVVVVVSYMPNVDTTNIFLYSDDVFFYHSDDVVFLSSGHVFFSDVQKFM